MREKRATEKKHLPASVYEIWLKSQHPGAGQGRHKTPPTDVYEAWVEGRAHKKARASKAG